MLLFSRAVPGRPDRLRVGDAGRLRRLGAHGRGRRPRVRGRARPRAQAPHRRRRRAVQLRRPAQPGHPAEHAGSEPAGGRPLRPRPAREGGRSRPGAGGDPPGSIIRAPTCAGPRCAGCRIRRLRRPGARIRAHAETDPMPAVRAVALRAVVPRGGPGSHGPGRRAPSTIRAPRCAAGRPGGAPRESAQRPPARAWPRWPPRRRRPTGRGRRGSRARSRHPRLGGSPLGPARGSRVRRAPGRRGRGRTRRATAALWPAVVGRAGRPPLARGRVAALALGGRDVAEVLAPCLQARRGQPPSPGRRRACSGRMSGPHAPGALFELHVGYPDPIVSPGGAGVAAACRADAPPADGAEATAVRRQLEEELETRPGRSPCCATCRRSPSSSSCARRWRASSASAASRPAPPLVPARSRRHPARARWASLTDRARSGPTRWRSSTSRSVPTSSRACSRCWKARTRCEESAPLGEASARGRARRRAG